MTRARDVSNIDGLLTAKGDIYAATAAGTPARLGVGANGTVLTADSTASTGVAWASSSSFDPLFNIDHPSYYVRCATSSAVSEANFAEDVTFYMPLFLSSGTFDRIGIQTGSGFVGSANVRLGLYNANQTTGKPTTVAFDAGTVTCLLSATTYEITISQSVTSGWYFLAFNSQTVGTTNQFTRITSTSALVAGILPIYTSLGSASPASFYSQTGVTGAFATAGTLVAPSANGPLVALRIA